MTRLTMKRLRAFSLVEMLIALLVFVILGGAFIVALWVTWGGYLQTQDVVWGRQDIEYAFQTMSLQLSNSSLGMPNARNEIHRGSFSNSFRGENTANDPIMAFMGENGQSWGGPVTLADFGYNRKDPNNPIAAPAGNANFRDTMVKTPVSYDVNIYDGTALYYVWAAPIPKKDRRDTVTLINPVATESQISNDGTAITFNFIDDSDASLLSNFIVEGRSWKLEDNNGNINGLDIRNWAVSPTIGLPLLVNRIDTGSVEKSIEFKIAPGTPSSVMKFEALVGGYAELYAVQACRLYVNGDNELVQEIFGSNFRDSRTSVINILARNAVGTYFVFDKARHLLSMYIAIRGEESGGGVAAHDGHPQSWPASAPPIGYRDRRVTVQNMTWRIRN